MNKLELKDYMIQLELENLKRTKKLYTDNESGNALDTNQVVDIDDQSHLNASAEVSEKLDAQVQLHQDNIERLNQLDFKPSTTVVAGSVVQMDGNHLVISTSIGPFDFDNKKFIGVSVDAPLYKPMMGKKVGDEFSYNDVKFLIENIY